jgi:hypothetical protein
MKLVTRASILSIPILAAFSLFIAPTSQAATFTLNPSADAFVTTGPTGNLSANNYGGAGALSVAAPGLAQGEFQSVLQFNFAAAKSSFDATFGAGQWTIQSISLQLTATAPNNAIFNGSSAGQFSMSWMQNDAWVEGSGTPTAPSPTGINFTTLQSTFISGADQSLGTFSFAGGTSGTATYNLNLSAGLSADALAGALASMRMFAADSAVSYLSDSRSFGTAGSRPLLTITAVPEPTCFALGLAGLGVFAVRRYFAATRQ